MLGRSKAVKHVIYIQFDNVHYTRDNRGVSSDLQQMPNLPRSSSGPRCRPRCGRGVLVRGLGVVYTQLEAPVGTFGRATLRASTRALASKPAHDRGYATTEAALARLGAQRDAIAGQIPALLLGAAFGGKPISPANAIALIREGNNLLREAAKLAS